MTAQEIRKKYLEYFEAKGHKVIPRALLVPQDDPTTLFTGSGMQPLVPFLLGEKHPDGTRLVDSQTCFRAEDMEYYVRDAINKAGEAGNNFYWNGETATAVFQAIVPKLSRTNQKVEDDGLHVWWLDSGLGSMYRGVRAIVNDQDQLTISARISLQSIDLESEHTFPPHTDPQTIANILLRELVEQFQKQRPQGNLEALRKVTGFAFPT